MTTSRCCPKVNSNLASFDLLFMLFPFRPGTMICTRTYTKKTSKSIGDYLNMDMKSIPPRLRFFALAKMFSEKA